MSEVECRWEEGIWIDIEEISREYIIVMKSWCLKSRVKKETRGRQVEGGNPKDHKRNAVGTGAKAVGQGAEEQVDSERNAGASNANRRRREDAKEGIHQEEGHHEKWYHGRLGWLPGCSPEGQQESHVRMQSEDRKLNAGTGRRTQQSKENRRQDESNSLVRG